MKVIAAIFFFVFTSFSFTSAQEKSEINKSQKKESTNSIKKPSQSQDNSKDKTGDEQSGNGSAQADGSGGSQDANQAAVGDQSGNKESAVPTGTRTTSPSGSPGVLIKDQHVPDGTNTLQSAEPNIAGSPLPGKPAKANRDKNSAGSNTVENKSFSGDGQKRNAASEARSNEKKSSDKKKK